MVTLFTFVQLSVRYNESSDSIYGKKRFISIIRESPSGNMQWCNLAPRTLLIEVSYHKLNQMS